MRAVHDHEELSLQLVTGASAILDRFGNVDQLIRSDGFHPNFTFHNIVEGENPITMAKSTGRTIYTPFSCTIQTRNLHRSSERSGTN